MGKLIANLLASTAVMWAAPDGGSGGNGDDNTQPGLDLASFDLAMGNGDMADQSTDAFEEEEDNAAQLNLQDGGQHIDSGSDEANTGVRQDNDGNGEGEGEGEGEQPKKPEPKTDPAKPAEPAADEEDESKLPEWMQKRLAREKRKQARLEATIAELSKGKSATPAPAADPGKAPVAADFDDFEDYLEAKAKHDAAKKAQPVDNKDKSAPAADADMPPAEEFKGAIADLDVALQAFPDLHKAGFDQSNPKGLKITPPMVIAMADADHPEAIMQAFVDNPDLSKEIAALSPVKAAARIAKMDKPLAKAAPAAAPGKAAPAAEPAKPAPKISQAPDPITPLAGANRPTPSYEEADFSTFENLRKQETEQSTDFW